MFVIAMILQNISSKSEVSGGDYTNLVLHNGESYLDPGTFFVMIYSGLLTLIVAIAVLRQKNIETNIHNKIKMMCVYTFFSVLCFILLVAGVASVMTYDPAT